MKLIKYVIAIALVTVLSVSCENKDGQLFNDFQRGAIPLFAAGEGDSGFINLSDLDNVSIEFSVDVEGLAEVESFDLFVVFNNLESEETDTVKVETSTTWPKEYSLVIDDVIDLFDPSIVTRDILEPGDSFTFFANITTQDGRYLNGGYSPSVTGNKAVTLNYNVSCASAIPLGMYTAVSTATSTDGCPPTNPLVDYTYDVELTADGPGEYIISDFFAGVYINWYGDCYGYDFETAAGFTDVCNTLGIDFVEGFGAGVQGSGSYDPGTGVITYSWVNDFGDEGTTTLTPK